jgi:cyclopropane-fatty-acyl-phospholipid synthase
VTRAVLHRLLRNLHDGNVVLVEGDRRTELGPPSGLSVEVRVHEPAAYRRAILHGSIGLADSYVDGQWDCDDLVDLIRVAARNVTRLDRLRRRCAPVLVPWHHLQAVLRPMTPHRARRDIEAHYDLSNELYALFLDETLSYSCAVFDGPHTTLRDAQEAKLDRICRKLDLGPGDHLLEIGSGWGGLAIHAARSYGCRVTTTTISTAQREEAIARVRAAGLEERVTVLDQDYRELRGTYRKIVSVEMIEAVGWRHLGTYLRQCGALLAEDGLFCLQAITMDERAFDVEKGGRSFANTRIFPGGFVPSLGAIVEQTAKRTAMRPVHVEEIGPHYATTLRHWRERFEAAAGRLPELGFDDRFRRLWRFYLSYMEAGFRERRIGDVQVMLAGPAFRAEDSLYARAAGLPGVAVSA